MLNRKRRKGFWWYSWILVLLATGGTVGGYFYGNKTWEEGPKEYRAVATVQAQIRRPFDRGKEVSDTPGVRNINQSEVKRVLEGVGVLRPVMKELKLTGRWGLTESEALKLLSSSVNVSVSPENEITLTVTRDSAEEAAEIANAVAELSMVAVLDLDDEKKTKALELLDQELVDARKPIITTLRAVEIALKANGVPIVPTAETNLRPYLEIEEVLKANVDLDGAKDDLADVERKQVAERTYWDSSLADPKLSEKAEPPAKFSGPDKLPIQKEFALYGLTAGLLLGLILMFLLWKLFSPKRT